jgi:hypothetical protein
MIITEIFFYKISNTLKSSIHECQYILIFLSKGLCWKLLSNLKKGKKTFVLLSSTLTYTFTELELHFIVRTERVGFEYYSTDSDSVQNLVSCLRVFLSVLKRESCGTVLNPEKFRNGTNGTREFKIFSGRDKLNRDYLKKIRDRKNGTGQ